MIATVARRLAAALLLLFLVLSATFLLLELAPGDPAQLFVSPRVPPAAREALRHAYGLDRPLGERYLRWLGEVARGNWGISFAQGRPAAQVVAEAMPATLLLAAGAVAVELPLGLFLGLLAARHAGSAVDHGVRLASLVLYGLPAFWVGLLAILLLHQEWRLFPASHLRSATPPAGAVAGALDVAWHLALPALVLGLVGAGEIARFVRSGVLETLGGEPVRAARARGLGERRILWVHALRAALPPVAQILGTGLPALLSGVLVVEVVFAWPGLGRVAYDAILTRDAPLVLATTAVAGALVVLGTLAADLLQLALDPRQRQG